MPPGKGPVPEQAGTGPCCPKRGHMGGQSWLGGSVSPKGPKTLQDPMGMLAMMRD